ncbi:transcriptional regulator [Bradyrhizobium sp. AS23.2]|uniref:transcriptional regulator n=1 Tax=Bradyrhizobium sp. AS23.2 TaxID=1680155 RepID=UPI0009402263|nr:transcriptional regulator [Bradyrhizobium sp. AS23.2]
MSARKSAEPSPEGIARSDRKRLAAEEGARALADVERQAIAVRANMTRLREAREAKEAADAALQRTSPTPTATKRSRKPPR